MNSVDAAGAESEERLPEISSGAFSTWGDIRLKRDAVVEAKIKGNVHAEQKLILNREAEVSGWVRGVDVYVQGKVEGGLEASGQVWLKKGATLRKQCVAQGLRMESGVDFRGELKVGGGRL